MSFVCDQRKNENDNVFVLETKHDVKNESMSLSIKKYQTDIQIGDLDYEQYFLDFIVKEAEREQLTIPAMKDEDDYDPLTAILISHSSRIAMSSRRGAGNIGIINPALKDRVEVVMKTVNYLFNNEFIINDNIPENIVIIMYKDDNELDGPFFIGRNDMAFLHPNWKDYIRVLELI